MAFLVPLVVVYNSGSVGREVSQDQSSLRIECKAAMTPTNLTQFRQNNIAIVSISSNHKPLASFGPGLKVS